MAELRRPSHPRRDLDPPACAIAAVHRCAPSPAPLEPALRGAVAVRSPAPRRGGPAGAGDDLGGAGGSRLSLAVHAGRQPPLARARAADRGPRGSPCRPCPSIARAALRSAHARGRRGPVPAPQRRGRDPAHLARRGRSPPQGRMDRREEPHACQLRASGAGSLVTRESESAGSTARRSQRSTDWRIVASSW